MTADRAADEFKAREDVIRANCDGTGIGAAVVPLLIRNGCPAASVKVACRPTKSSEIGEFYILRDQLWWSVREWLRADPGAMLPADELLTEDLQVATYSVENGKIRVMKNRIMRDLLKRSPDRADALCLTFAPAGAFGALDLR